MRYEAIHELKSEAFKRLTGVKPEVFKQMVGVLREAETRKQKSGRPSKLSLEDKLLLAMSYWREYRTQFHIAKSYGIHEANANRIIRKVEGALAASGAFKLPGKRAVRSDEGVELSFVVIDATETPVERPKKTAAVL